MLMDRALSMDGTDTLNCFFNPRTIAVIGASNKKGKMGNIFVQHLLDGFAGKIFPVHPTAKQIAGIPAYPDMTAIPQQIDLAIPLIPTGQLLAFVKSCAPGQVRFLLAIPSGFGEVPEGGKALEQELVRMARARKMRIVGPNTAGMLNCPNGLNASMIPELPPGGPGFSCLTQSGGFGMAVYMYTRDHQLEMAKFCDLGNTADIGLHEVLYHLANDADTRVVGIFLESVTDPQAFFDQVNALAKVKPIILTKLGRTAAGRRASLAHLGIAPDGIDMDQAEGADQIIPAQTGLEMLDIAKGLSWQPIPRGRKVGILTGAGGIGAELTDLCIEQGLEVPEFSGQLQKALRPYLPSYTSVQNPVDLTPLWWEFSKLYPPLIQTLSASEEVDLVIVTIIDVATTVEELMVALTETVAQAREGVFPAKPLYVYWGARDNMLPHMRILEAAHIPCYRSTLETVRAAAGISRYGMITLERGI